MCSLKSSNFWSVTRLAPLLAFCMIPDTTLHALALRPTVCHPSSDLPLNSVAGVPQAAALARLSEGAFVPVHVNFWPFPIVVEPLMRSPSSRPSNAISAGLLSPLGGGGKQQETLG